MKSSIDQIENIISKAGDLAETKVELWKLRAVGKISETVSSIISVMAITVLIGIAICILSLGVALWIGNTLGNMSYGFFIVGGFYAFAGLLVFLFRKLWIKKPISQLIINKIAQ